MANILNNFKATGYNAEIKNGSAHGTINCDGDYNLVQLNCTIDDLGSFSSNGHRGDGKVVLNFSAEVDKGEQLAAAAAALVEGIKAELAAKAAK